MNDVQQDPNTLERATPEQATARGKEKTSTYVVQKAVEESIEGVVSAQEPTGLWLDVATVQVPIRSHKRTAVIAALEELEIGENDYPLWFRPLDEDAADPVPVRLERPPAPPPVVKVG